MLNKARLSLILLFVALSVCKAQEKYLVGSAKVSIDPDSSVFSLPLAGYGAPREGRFSLAWQFANDAPGIKLLTAMGGKLYGIDATGNLLVAGSVAQRFSPKYKGTLNDALSITGLNGKLYAVTAGKELISFDISKNRGWQKVASSAINITALTTLAGSLYATTADSKLLTGSINKTGINWNVIGEAKQMHALTADGNKIYGVDSENTLYSINPAKKASWLKIGVNNSSTYKVNIKQLVVSSNKLYVLGNDNKLYRETHNSDGSLSSRALAIKSKNKTVVIITLDLTGFDHSLAQDIKSAIFKTRKIPPSAILINASHTHFAPVSQWFPTFGEHGQIPDSAWFNKVLKRAVIRSIENALDNMEASALYFGRGSTNIGHNRSSANNETPYDNTVDVLKVENNKNAVSELLFITGCHPVFRNEGKEGVMLSANYPGVSRNVLEKKTGCKEALFLQGCAGDINPKSDDHTKTGNDLAADVLTILDGKMSQVNGNIAYTLDTLNIPVTPWSKEKIEEFKASNLKEPGNVYAEKNVRWATMMLGYYEHNTMPKAMPVYLQTITIGNWKLVGLSREVVTEYGPAIRAIWPDKLVSVAGYCNDVPSYLPIARHIKAETYEGVDSFFWNAQPALFPEDIFDKVINAIKSIKN